MMRYAIVALLLITLAGAARAQEAFPNWKSCSVDFWGNAADLRDLRNGVPVQNLGRNAGVIRDTLKIGVFKAVTTIQTVYTNCIQEFAQGKWIAPPPYEKYGGCAYANTIFLAVLLRLEQGESLEQIRAILPAQWHSSAEVIARNFLESRDKAAIMAMEGSQDCIGKATQD